MTNDYIRRQDVVKECGDWYVEEGSEEGFIGTVEQLVESMLDSEALCAVPIICENTQSGTYWYVCGECGYPVDSLDNFCGGCGRRLIKDE